VSDLNERTEQDRRTDEIRRQVTIESKLDTISLSVVELKTAVLSIQTKLEVRRDEETAWRQAITTTLHDVSAKVDVLEKGAQDHDKRLSHLEIAGMNYEATAKDVTEINAKLDASAARSFDVLKVILPIVILAIVGGILLWVKSLIKP
jgi:hypothetical protein